MSGKVACTANSVTHDAHYRRVQMYDERGTFHRTTDNRQRARGEPGDRDDY